MDTLIPKRFGTACLALLLAGCATETLQSPTIRPPVIVEEAYTPEHGLPEPIVETPSASVLTAGEIDDSRNLAAFLTSQTNASQSLGLPKANLSNPILAKLVSDTGAPAPGVRITLRKPGAARPFYDGFSGLDGEITLFPATLGAKSLRTVELRAFPDGAEAPVIQELTSTGTRQTVAVPDHPDRQPDFLDLAFVIDTTGSMSDEMEWLIRDLSSILKRVKRENGDVDIRLGLVVYKSRGDRYVVKSYGFTKTPAQFRHWLQGELPTSGGQGAPEAVADALAKGVALNWRRGHGERLLFQIGDEPPHENKTRAYFKSAGKAATKGVQIFNVEASSRGGHLEYLMRQGALISNGRYIFLTDDSGVGLSHKEPAVSCYKVTSLNALMVRLIKSELTGRRIPAPKQEVIRKVGSASNGTCLD